MAGTVIVNPVSSLLIDENGNKVGIVLDGIIYRLQVETKIATGHGLATETKQDSLITELSQKLEPADIAGLATHLKQDQLYTLTSGIKDDTSNLDVALSTIATQTTVAGILTELQQKTEPSDLQKVVPHNSSGLQLPLVDGQNVSGIQQPGLLFEGLDSDLIARRAQITIDESDGKRRLAVEGKVTVSPPPAPPGTTEVIISAEDPLSMSGTQTVEHTIANGKIFHIQQITAGAEGDPNEKGSKVEVIYYDGTVEHIVERIYVVGFTQFGIYPDTSKARDGTPLSGNGSTKKIRIRRNRLGGNTLEVDAVVRGYEQ